MILFPMFSVFFVYLLTTFRPCFQLVLFSIFIDFFIFLLHIWHNTQYSTQHTHSQPHTRTHTCTPATDRDLENGLSKSHTRKNPRKMPEKGKVRGNSGEGLVSRSTGKSFVCGEVAKDQSNHLVAGSLRNFSNFQEKVMIRGTGARVVLDPFSN